MVPLTQTRFRELFLRPRTQLLWVIFGSQGGVFPPIWFPVLDMSLTSVFLFLSSHPWVPNTHHTCDTIDHVHPHILLSNVFPCVNVSSQTEIRKICLRISEKRTSVFFCTYVSACMYIYITLVRHSVTLDTFLVPTTSGHLDT